MGLYINQNQNRTELQQRLDAELRAKVAARSKQDNLEHDGIDDSAYIEGTKQTTSLDWAWLVIGLVVIILLGTFIYMLSQG